MAWFPRIEYMKRMAEGELTATMKTINVHLNRKQVRELANTIANWVPHWHWIYDRYENLSVTETLRMAAWTWAHPGAGKTCHEGREFHQRTILYIILSQERPDFWNRILLANGDPDPLQLLRCDWCGDAPDPKQLPAFMQCSWCGRDYFACEHCEFTSRTCSLCMMYYPVERWSTAIRW